MKKENCPFCGHRWIRKSSESMIECPNCRTEYFIHPRQEEIEEEEIGEDEETIADEFEERNL
jgi:predicted  nucleic acid-binding Zn-ribbon protein